MELLRRAVLTGALLTSLWLLRLAPLDPLLTIAPVDFARMQQEEARSVPDEQKTEAQRRRAVLPLSVYIEEFLQYNVVSASGPEWDRFLRSIDERTKALGPGAGVFVRPVDPPMANATEKLAAGGGTTYVSFTRPDVDVYYRVTQHRWTREDFPLGTRQGVPVPPASLFYPFRRLGWALMFGGIALFLLVPTRPASVRRPRVLEATGLVAGLFAFALPLFLIGGSAQALTRTPGLTASCWMVTAIGAHLFAAPWRNAPHPIAATVTRIDARFLREGLVFLLMALGPLGFVIWGTMVLWNR